MEHDMRFLILTAVTALPALVATSNVVLAQSAPPPNLTQAEIEAIIHNPAVHAAVSACSDDRFRLCGGVFPGGGRVLRCLAANAEKVSPGCRSAIDSAAQSVAAARDAH
jgi:hypothetical protein